MVDTLEVDTAAAEAYENLLVPGLIAPWAEALVSQARIEKGMSALDVACGTGIVARHAAREYATRGRVVGVDIDPGMLEVARAASGGEGLQVEYVYASACKLPFQAESFDVVLCLQGLQYFPNPQEALSEMRRVLRTDSRLIAATWSELVHCKGWWTLVSALERRNIDATAARKPFSLSDANQIRLVAGKAGLRDVAIRTERCVSRFQSGRAFVQAMLQGAPSSRQALERISSDEWPDFLTEIENMLAPWRSRSGLEFPTESNVLEARR